MMTRKDFQLIADAFKYTKPWCQEDYPQWCRDVTRMSMALRGANARFDRHQFLKACGVDESGENPEMTLVNRPVSL